MADKTQTVVQRQGIGTLGFLTIIFVIAKLAGVIHWSWWLVLLPLYGGLALLLAIMLVIGVVAGLAFILAAIIK